MIQIIRPTTNLSQNPIITRCKTIRVPVQKPTDALVEPFPFPFDRELDNSIIKGIRWEEASLRGTVANSTISYQNLPVNTRMMTLQTAKKMMITLVDSDGRNILFNYPLVGLAGKVLDLTGSQRNRVIPRFNCRLAIRKCYLINIASSAIPVGDAMITFYFVPLLK